MFSKFITNQIYYWQRMLLVLCSISLFIALLTFKDYAIAWDYEAHDSYGVHVASFYTSLGKDQSAAEVPMRLYGGVFEIFVNTLRPLLPGDFHEKKFLATFLFSIIGVFGAYCCGSLIGKSRAGFFSALFLITFPMYYGHGFINHKDLPLAVTYIWAMWAVLKSMIAIPTLSLKNVLQCGVTIGCVLGVRAGSIFIIPILSGGWALSYFYYYICERPPLKKIAVKLLSGTGYGILTVAVAWATLCLVWPYAMMHPIDAPLASIIKSSSYPWSFPVLFEGKIFIPPNIPSTYVITWFMIQIPEFIFISFGCGAAVLASVVFRMHFKVLRNQNFYLLTFLMFSIAAPIGAAILTKAVVYDGVRHFLFIVPVLCVLAGVSFSAWLSSESIVNSQSKTIVNHTMLITYLVTIGSMASLHPYQYTYFNYIFGGGLSRAGQRFESDYWATCIKESFEWVVSNHGAVPGKPTNIAAWVENFQLQYYIDKYKNIRPDIVFTPNEAESNIYITTSRFNGHLNKPYKLIHTIDRQGTKLCYIFER